MNEFLIFLGLALGAALVVFLYPTIRDLLYKAKSTTGKIEVILKKDMSQECARCTFYAFHDYSKQYSQREWMQYYQEQTKGLDKKSQAYADALVPFANAIVVQENGMFQRRGMENLRCKYIYFEPGVNDSVSLNFFVEPYEYKKSKIVPSSFKRTNQRTQEEEDRGRARAAAQHELKQAEWEYSHAMQMHKSCKGKVGETHWKTKEASAYAALLSARAKYDSLK